MMHKTVVNSSSQILEILSSLLVNTSKFAGQSTNSLLQNLLQHYGREILTIGYIASTFKGKASKKQVLWALLSKHTGLSSLIGESETEKTLSSLPAPVEYIADVIAADTLWDWASVMVGNMIGGGMGTLAMKGAHLTGKAGVMLTQAIYNAILLRYQQRMIQR